uniref:Nicolin 1 n=1 Tax=Oryzias latipes TaxID=8090 RepID=A0A3P9IJ57_ORYLA
MSCSADHSESVDCTVKPPVFLQIGDAKGDSARSGVCVVDVTLPHGKLINIEKITFKNYYTAYVTIRLLRRKAEKEGSAKWCTALRDLALMDNPHTEGGSQNYFSIHRRQVEPDHVESLRLILRQPSSAWRLFNLEEIRLFPHKEPFLIKVRQIFSLQGLPDPQTVSSSIQQMWALTEVMQANRTTASIGRFDVDGCYDINLLSLT